MSITQEFQLHPCFRSELTLSFALDWFLRFGFVRFALYGRIENLLWSSSGATIASLSLPFFVLAFLTVVLVPDDTAVLVVSQYLAALTLAGVGTGLVVGGNVVNYINE